MSSGKRARIYDPIKERARNLWRRYRMTLDDWQDMYAAQRGRCMICGSKPKKLIVDHDHKTGRVRALLCHHCNIMLGRALDEARILRRAADYLEGAVLEAPRQLLGVVKSRKHHGE